MKTKLQSDGTSCPAALLRLGVPAQRLTGVETRLERLLSCNITKFQ